MQGNLKVERTAMQATVFKCKLTAILSADAVGYSRLMNDDEMYREIDHLSQKKKKTQALENRSGFFAGNNHGSGRRIRMVLLAGQ